MLKKLLKRNTYRSIRRKLFPYKRLPDEFYDALYVSINGAPLFIPENTYCVDLAIRNLPTDDPVVEIGSFTGMSTCMLSHFLELHQRRNTLFNVDKWEFEEKEKQYYSRVLKVTPETMKHYIRESFIRNLQLCCGSRLPATIELFSDDFFECWNTRSSLVDLWGRTVMPGGPISFAYLDGNHQYAFVKRDFDNVSKWLVKDGFIFFDDSDPAIKSGVRDFVQEGSWKKEYELVIKNPNYLLRKIR